MNAKKVPNSPRSYFPAEPHCIGREDEEEKCLEALLDSKGWGVTIAGVAGIGKSTFALRVGHAALKDHRFLGDERFKFEAYNYVSATPQLPDAPPLTTSGDVVQALAVSLGYEEEIVQAGPVAKYYSKLIELLGERRTLLIIDNIDEFPDQERQRINQFLKALPGNIKVILTIRDPSDFSGAQCIISLKKMSLSATRDLIRRYIDDAPYSPRKLRDDAGMDSLHEVVGGSPYVLNYTLGLIFGSSRLSYSEAIERVQDATKSPDLYKFIFRVLCAI